LGDSTYEFYCQAGKRLDARFEELGAKRLATRVGCDVDYDDAAAAWTESIVAQLAAEEKAAAPVISVQAATGAATASAYDRRNPFPAQVLDNIVIVGRGSTKKTRHLAFSLEGSALTHEPGDALGIAASNAPAVVASL